MKSIRTKLLAPLLIAVLYVFAVGFTNAYFMGDSGGYVVSILAYAGVSEYVAENPTAGDHRSSNSFWEFGHLFWRPLGLLLFNLFTPNPGADPAYNARSLLIYVNLVAGLVSAVLLYILIDRLTKRPWCAAFATACFVFSHAFLNFTQTGNSYVAGLAFLVIALYLLLKDKDQVSRFAAICAGVACAGAVTFWAPYVLVVPGTIVAPIVLSGWNGRQKLNVLWTAGAFVLSAAAGYLIIMVIAGVHTPSDLLQWISTSSHGIRTTGLARLLFGLPRSFIHLGNDGVLFKRFLLSDPFNPVRAIDLIRFSLWILVLFYLALGSVLISLILGTGRRILLLLLLMSLPLFLFALTFDVGSSERYLPLYPLFFLALAWVLSDTKVPRLLKIAPVLFFSIAVLANSSAMARIVLDKQKQATMQRLEAVVPQLKPNSWLITTHLQDDLVNFQASFPFEPINRHNNYHIYSAAVVNTDQAGRWQQEFADHTLETWAKDGYVWLSTRLLSSKPEAAWNWVEGDDPRLRWHDLRDFFAQLQTCGVTTGGDGFVQLSRSEANINFLKSQTNQAMIHSVSTKDCR